MKRLTIISLLLATLISIFLPACEGIDDNFSTNPSHRLSFSVDTLTFDTIFSSIGSATRQFMIYNPNSEPINIESVLLADAGISGFRINVDGRMGDSFQNISIRAKDSLYVFVEVTVNPNGQNQPLLVKDSVLFSLNGNRQSVLLEAYGQDVHLMRGGVTLAKDTVLLADRPYLLYDSLVVAPGVTAEIAEGATFYMHDKANFVVYGTVIADGSREFPITFRGDRLDFILDDLLPYDRMPAQWGGIFFQSESFGNRMDHTIIRNGTTGITCWTSSPDKSKLILSNSQVTNMKENLLSSINCDIEVTNSELSNAGGIVTALMGGRYQFTHSTIANYMSLTKRIDNSFTLLLTNALPEKQTAPVTARFDNCVIDGGYSPTSLTDGAGEILLDIVEGVNFSYHFNHCVMKIDAEKEKDNPQLENVIAVPYKRNETYKVFRTLGGKDNKYSYDFQLDSVNTVGVGTADRTITTNYPIDRKGIDRLTAPNGPTIGAYEFVPAPEDEDE